MISATLSNTYQLQIPEPIREDLNLQSGQQFTILVKGGIIELTPLHNIKEMRGFLKGCGPTGYRD